MKKNALALAFLCLGLLPLACTNNTSPTTAPPAPVTVYVYVTATFTATFTVTPTPSPTPCTACLNNNQIGISPAFSEFQTIGPGDMWLERVTVTQSGTIKGINFGFSGAGFPATVQFGIYSDNGSGYGPTSLLGISQPQSIGSGYGGGPLPNICVTPGYYWAAVGVPSNGVSVGVFFNQYNSGGELYFGNYAYFPPTYPVTAVGNGYSPVPLQLNYCY